MSQWFTKRPNEERRGPFSDEQLRRQAESGELRQSDLVWCEGLEMALPAVRIPGLFPPPPPVPPERNARQTSQDAVVPAARTDVEHTEEEDVFSWYRPGDSRAPIIVNWLEFWQFVHSIGSRNKRLYYVMPVAAALPLGLLLGVVTSFVPLVLLNYVIIVGVGIVFGESIYECIRLKNGGKLLDKELKFHAALFGFAAALVFGYFYTVGGFFTDMNRAGFGRNISTISYFLPWNIVYYIQAKSQSMVVARFTDLDKTGPQFVINCIMIAVEYLLLILIVTVSARGGKREIQEEDV